MGLFSRSAGDAECLHARVSDGEHLWLAVRGAEEPLALVGDGVAVPVDARPDGELLTAVVPLAASWPEGEQQLLLVHGRKQRPVPAALAVRPSGPTVPVPLTADGRWQLGVTVLDDTVVVSRAPAPAGVAVVTFAPGEGGVEVLLADGRRVVLPEVVGPVAVDGVPVVRGRNVLDRPNFAVSLPPLADDGLEVRWSKDGRLLVVATS